MAYIAVAGIAVSVGTTFFGASQAKKQASKQREDLLNVETAKIASNEKIAYEEIRTKNETDRLQMFTNSSLKYRESLQKESTIRLRDTWIYVAGLGCGTGVIYGVFLMASKGKQNG